MWDVDDSGCINLKEMTNIMATMDDLEGAGDDPKVPTNHNTRFNICQYLLMVVHKPALHARACMTTFKLFQHIYVSPVL